MSSFKAEIMTEMNELLSNQLAALHKCTPDNTYNEDGQDSFAGSDFESYQEQVSCPEFCEEVTVASQFGDEAALGRLFVPCNLIF